MDAEVILDGRNWAVVINGEDLVSKLKVFKMEIEADINKATELTLHLREHPGKTVIKDGRIFLEIGWKWFELVKCDTGDGDDEADTICDKCKNASRPEGCSKRLNRKWREGCVWWKKRKESAVVEETFSYAD